MSSLSATSSVSILLSSAGLTFFLKAEYSSLADINSRFLDPEMINEELFLEISFAIKSISLSPLNEINI